MLLTNKTVFITGGANGIGAACSKALVQRGAKVVIADIDETKGKELVEKLSKKYGLGKVLFVRCDVTDAVIFKDAFQKAVTTFKQVDVMVNNAGVLGEQHWERMLDVNIKGPIHGTDLALAHMRKDKGGQGGIVINVSSRLGYKPSFFYPVYVASKHGIIGFTRSMAAAPDIRELGVRYACLCPQLVDTGLNGTLGNFEPTICREGYYEEVLQVLSGDKLSQNTVAEGLLSLIADDDSNGALLEISVQEGLVRKNIIAEDV